ncbi:hypothetical protein DPMN_111050 [Dreissena polymorpha]|uniref:Uncharacterized protein n=1 Tax=Dreissena polymorpha TaxID=45954 RepID=A0A9D4KD46_DREPO|nr:hypothetical protein DPMN_111050 [Dreissena polymorpha]
MTVCDGAKTVWVHALEFHTVCDGARQSLRQAGHMQEIPRQSAPVPGQSPRPARHQQETPRQSSTVLRPFGLLQETPTQSTTVPESLRDRRFKCGSLLDYLRLCQNRLDTCKRLPGILQRYHDRLVTWRKLPDSLRRCQTVFLIGGAAAGYYETV